MAMTRMPGKYDGYLAGRHVTISAGRDRNQSCEAIRDDLEGPVRLGTAFTSSERAALSAAV